MIVEAVEVEAVEVVLHHSAVVVEDVEEVIQTPLKYDVVVVVVVFIFYTMN